ncbi:MAG: hypothetical protein IT168_04750 [Bryobacterales bacterium]|nr:hypothetical protein [Bryobacterales bacterium]
MPHPRVVLVGGETLLGADVRELLAERFPNAKVKLAGSMEENTAIITEQGGEAVVMTGLDEQALGEASVVILAGSPESTRRTQDLLRHAEAEPPLIDLSFALEDRPEARLRAPLAEPPAGLGPARVQVVAHPAAVLAATVLRGLHTIAPIQRSVVNLFAPASEMGRLGVDELQRQTVQLLSFQTLEQDVFGAQMSFNLLSGRLPEVEHRIERHLATLLSAGTPVALPSLRITQAAVMHGYSASIWVELETPVDRVAGKLRDEGIDVWTDDAPNVVGIAGQNGVSIGNVETDRNNRRALWLWAVADNFRVSAENAVILAEPYL